MKVSTIISSRLSKIVQKKRFVKDILKSIIASSGRALLVGGAVRDLFLDVPIKDLDFEIYGLTLEQLQLILEHYGPVSMVGKSFGVLRLHGLDVDWSLPRKDSSGRHPIVHYDPCMSYDQAFIRRDLTVNAMGIDMQSLELIDPFAGMQDLEHKILRAPDLDFFGQDPLRLLRVMQFAARFEMQVDEKLSALCSSMDMSLVSVERIEQEFSKLFLQASKPSIGLQWLCKICKFQYFLPFIMPSMELWQSLDRAAVQIYQNDQEKLIMMWTCGMSYCHLQFSTDFKKLTHQDTKIIVDSMQRVSRHDYVIKQVAYALLYAQMITDSLTDAQIKWLALWLAPDLSLDFLSRVIAVRYKVQVSQFLYNRAHSLAILFAPQAPLLQGKDFLDVAQGATIGLLVKKAYRLQIDENITDMRTLKKICLSS